MIRREFVKNSLLGTAAVATAGALSGFTGEDRARTGVGAEPARPAPCAPPAFPSTPGLTNYVTDFILKTQYGDIPAEVIARGKKTLLDAFGVALSGSVSHPGVHIRTYLDRQGFARGPAGIVGTAMKASPRFAAMANGVAIHADDFDDSGSALHSSAPLLPAVLAHCEVGRRGGKDLMLAYHIGVEVENKIGDASPGQKYDGFHTVGTCGVFGSAAACAKLLGLSHEQTAMALGIAGSEASGLRRNYGTMSKAFNAGHGAAGGVEAADLAAIGYTAATDILEAKLGFFQAYAGTYTPSLILHRLGNPWMFLSPGDLIKRFPCGTIQQAIMDEMLRLVHQHRIQAGDVASVDVGGNRRNIATLMRHRPQTGLEAKFSMEYAVAVILVEGKAGLAQFTDAVVQQPRMQAMIARVRYYDDPEYDTLPANADIEEVLVEKSIIKIHMKNGQTFTGVTQPAKGSPQNPMTYDEVADKFRGNADYAQWPKQKADSIVETVRLLEKVPDITPLIAALTV